MVISAEQTYGTQEHYIDGDFRAERGRGDVRDAQPDDQRGAGRWPPPGEAEDIDAAVARRAARSTRARGRG